MILAAVWVPRPSREFFVGVGGIVDGKAGPADSLPEFRLVLTSLLPRACGTAIGNP